MPTSKNFLVAARATGPYNISTLRDHWILDRTKQWCLLYARGQWRFTTDREQERITFSFSHQDDADEFRRATAASETLVTCE